MADKLWMSAEFAEAVRRVIAQVESEQKIVPRRSSFPSIDELQEVLILGKTDAAINKNASGTVSIYGQLGDTTGSETDTDDNIEDVYNRFANVAINKWVYVLPSFGGNGYELIAAEC